MSHITEELAELIDLFCEGDIAPEQAARLEATVAESDEARMHLLDCFDVHCELAWELRWQSSELGHAFTFDDVPDACSSEASQFAHCD